MTRYLPILISLQTEATTENSNATEEPIEADFLEGTSKSHKRDMMSSKPVKKNNKKTKQNKTKQKNPEKFLKTKKEEKLSTKSN